MSLVLRFALPGVTLAALAGLLIVASVLAPRHVGPLPSGIVLVIVALTPALVFAASRRLGPSTLGSLLAALMCTGLLMTASSDVAGVAEHLAVAMGLVTVVLWPREPGRPVLRYTAGVLAGAAIAVSPLAAGAVAAVIIRLILRADDRMGRARSLLGPVIAGSAAVLVGLGLLIATGWISGTTWAGSVSLATLVVSLAPAIGIAAGLGIDGALAGIGGRDTLPLVAGAVGAMVIVLLVAATIGSAISQVRDRVVSTNETPRASAGPAYLLPGPAEDRVTAAW